ncbi:MAG: type II secretion system F family protein [Patescibacteria group bacterium]
MKSKSLRSVFDKFFPRLGVRRDRVMILENLSLFISAGMSMGLALNSLRTEVRSGGARRLIERIRSDIDAGVPLWQTCRDAGLFTDYQIALLRIGEESGNLSGNLKVIVTQQKRDRMLKSKVRSAVMYPAIVLSITVAVGIGVSWFTLPKLATVFASLGVALPLPTRILVGIGGFLGKYGVVVVPIGLAAFGTLIYGVFVYRKTRWIGIMLLFKTPGVRGLLQEIELTRFGYVLGVLFRAGMPVLRSLESLMEATNFPRYQKFYAHLRDRIRGGDTFQEAMDTYPGVRGLFPLVVRYLISSAEQSGKLDNVLMEIGATYEEKTDATLKDLTTALEPILLVIIWVGVVAVATAVILPIYSLIGGINP